LQKLPSILHLSVPSVFRLFADFKKRLLSKNPVAEITI